MTVNQQKLEASRRLFADLSAGYGGVMVSLGDKLGLYKAMAGAGPLSSQEVARRSGCGERYVREWLNCPGRRRLCRLSSDLGDLRADAGAGGDPRRRFEPRLPAARLAGGRIDVGRRAEVARAPSRRARA